MGLAPSQDFRVRALKFTFIFSGVFAPRRNSAARPNRENGLVRKLQGSTPRDHLRTPRLDEARITFRPLSAIWSLLLFFTTKPRKCQRLFREIWSKVLGLNNNQAFLEICTFLFNFTDDRKTVKVDLGPFELLLRIC